jgi:hypothetical protein
MMQEEELLSCVHGLHFFSPTTWEITGTGTMGGYAVTSCSLASIALILFITKASISK